MTPVERNKIFQDILDDGAIAKLINALGKWKMYRGEPFRLNKDEMFSVVSCVVLDMIEKHRHPKKVLRRMWYLVKHANRYRNILYRMAAEVSGMTVDHSSYRRPESPCSPEFLDLISGDYQSANGKSRNHILDIPAFWIRISGTKYQLLVERFFYGLNLWEIAEIYELSPTAIHKRIRKLIPQIKRDIDNGKVSLWDSD